MLRLCAALRAKPFAILAGHSGTGKSRMVRVNCYTYIMVRPGENADERKERFQRLTGLY